MLKLKSRPRFPLECFSKCETLYQAQVKYLQSYQKRQTNPIIKERIGTILNAPHVKDPIFAFDYRVDYSKYLRKVKTPQPIKKTVVPSKISIWQSIINFVKRLFGVYKTECVDTFDLEEKNK